MFTKAYWVSDTMAKAHNGKRWVDYCPTDPSLNHHSVTEFIDGGGTMPEVEVQPTPEPPTYTEQREIAYKLEADPLYLAYQGQLADAGEETADVLQAKQDWLDKRQEIKTRFPKP